MHEHNNDEILSYMWRGTMLHEDAAGHRISILVNKLMMMNTGKNFWHEERTPDEPVRDAADLRPSVRGRSAGLALAIIAGYASGTSSATSRTQPMSIFSASFNAVAVSVAQDAFELGSGDGPAALQPLGADRIAVRSRSLERDRVTPVGALKQDEWLFVVVLASRPTRPGRTGKPRG